MVKYTTCISMLIGIDPIYSPYISKFKGEFTKGCGLCRVVWGFGFGVSRKYVSPSVRRLMPR